MLDWRARHEERRRIRKIARIAIAVAVVLAGIAIAALILAAYVDEKADRATAAQRTAEDAQREASAAREEALARLELGQDPDKAIKYALAATEGARSDTAQVTLRQVLARDGVATSISTRAPKRYATSKCPRRAHILRPSPRTAAPGCGNWGVRRRPSNSKGDGRNVAFDRSGERVAVAGKQVTVWSVERAAEGRPHRRTAESGQRRVESRRPPAGGGETVKRRSGRH